MAPVDPNSKNIAFVAVLAHIKGDKPGSARYDETMPDTERNSPDNIIVLCGTHHKIIDDQPDKYTVEVLLNYKKEHENWVINQFKKEVTQVTFSELDVVTTYLISNTSTDTEISLIHPKAKIEKNCLSPRTENLIKMGMIQASLVNDYIKQSIDPEFGERLKQKFVEEYNRLIEEENLEKDDLFEALLIFASGNSYDFKYSPTFRSCISYFARLNGKTGGFLSPFTQFKNQKEFDIQINNSFLLGLDWSYASQWQILKDRKKVLKQIKDEAESGILQEMHGSIGQLEAEKVRLEEDFKNQCEQLTNFKIHPQYKEIESQANKLTLLIHEYVNTNISEKNLLQHYNLSLKEEEDADTVTIEKMYNEAGKHLPELVKKRLSDVNKFHKNVVENRKDFLSSEISKINSEIVDRESKIKELSEKRTELMEILQKHKALDEYTSLQQRNSLLKSDLEDVKKRIENLKKFEQGASALKIDLELLQQRARTSLNERNKYRDKAIQYFNNNSQKLYNSPGILSIDIKPTGYKYDVDIRREGSDGIGNMKIFCYDLMRSQLMSNRANPGFLIHDSILFADVDERQVANALQLAAKKSLENNFQYICTLNSDTIPRKDFDESFDFDSYVRIILSDSIETGGLFGIRF